MIDWAALLERYGVEPAPARLLGAQLLSYQRDLLRFGRVRNLVSRRDPEQETASLMGEAIAACFCYGPTPGRACADLGSGAGLPGLVWAILHPELEMTLIERRRSRADFLLRECRALQLPHVEVLAVDAVSLPERPGFSGFDCILAKAVARPAQSLALAHPLLRPNAELLLFGRPNWNPSKDLEMRGWGHRELGLVPDPAGPTFSPSALHCFARQE